MINVTEGATSQANTKSTGGSDACPHCRGLGFVTPDVPPGDPEFGKVYPCQCRQEVLTARRADRLLRLSNLGLLAQNTFDNFHPEGVALNASDRRNLRNAYQTCKEFSAHPEGWLLITGTYGCGKTHLAAAITVTLVERGVAVLFQTVPDLLDHLRATYGPRSAVGYDQLFQDVREAPCLVLDDLGAQNTTPWALEKLYQILNHRYNNRLPTVITTNVPLEELDPRLRSRLTDEALVRRVAITAPDYRGSGATGPISDLSTLSLHADQTFESFDLRARELDADTRENLSCAYAAARQFAEEPQGFLLLQGDHYCGKTHLAAAIANARQAQGLQALFVEVPDLLDYLRAAFEPSALVSYDKRLQQVRRAPLLVLDNLGVQSSTPWDEKLHQLFSYRFNARLPTVITTSLTLEDIDPRLKVRLMDKSRCLIVPIVAPPYRGRSRSRASRVRRQV
ncbi:MAG: ATP-binding protein [Anaerolineae bacterium]|nr:ATP-binding protein [Anaerolineae bacterium]